VFFIKWKEGFIVDKSPCTLHHSSKPYKTSVLLNKLFVTVQSTKMPIVRLSNYFFDFKILLMIDIFLFAFKDFSVFLFFYAKYQRFFGIS